MRKVKVNLGKRSYKIIVGKYVFSTLKEELRELGLLKFQPLIVTNENIWELYGSYLKKNLPLSDKIPCLKIPDSERSKTWKVFLRVLGEILQYDRGRGIFLIAFGGGVVGDLTGFLAAVYKRGVPYVQLPTTLLSQVDSSIGGKVAIDLEFGKNLIGAFYQPRLVVSELTFLKTLPQSEIQNGLSEIIKYGVIKNNQIFSLLEENISQIYEWEPEDWFRLILNCIKIKAEIVEKDEFDNKDIRIILNFGHTIGHALEASVGYRTISHGEAVAFGMVVESMIAKEIRLLNKEDFERIINLILKLNSLLGLNSKVKVSEVINRLPFDKKARFGKLRLVLPTTIGKVKIIEGIKAYLIENCLKKALKYV